MTLEFFLRVIGLSTRVKSSSERRKNTDLTQFADSDVKFVNGHLANEISENCAMSRKIVFRLSHASGGPYWRNRQMHLSTGYLGSRSCRDLIRFCSTYVAIIGCLGRALRAKRCTVSCFSRSWLFVYPVSSVFSSDSSRCVNVF